MFRETPILTFTHETISCEALITFAVEMTLSSSHTASILGTQRSVFHTSLDGVAFHTIANITLRDERGKEVK